MLPCPFHVIDIPEFTILPQGRRSGAHPGSDRPAPQLVGRSCLPFSGRTLGVGGEHGAGDAARTVLAQ